MMNSYKSRLGQISILLAVVVLLSGALAPSLFAQVTIASGGFNSTNVCPSTSLTSTCLVATNGNAALSGDYLQLTASKTGQAGSAWAVAPQTVTNGFSASITFQFTNESFTPADGIAFVIQNAPSGLAAIGYGYKATPADGGTIGYGDDDSNKYPTSGIQNSLAIEFDSFKDSWDPNGNHVAVQSCGTAYNTSHHNQSCAITGGTSTNSTLGISTTVGALPITLSDGKVHTATIQYNPSGTPCDTAVSATNNLCIYLDQATYPTPVLTVNVNLSTLLTLGTGGTAYVGVTGATGADYETQDILGFTFAATVVQPYSLTGTTTANFSTTTNGVTNVNELSLSSANTNSSLVCNSTPTGNPTTCSANLELITSNDTIPIATWEQYVVGTPWDGSSCAAVVTNGVNTCTLYVNACYGGSITASEASDFYCPMLSPSAPAGSYIGINDTFTPPSPPVPITPGTTAVLLDFTPNTPSQVWAPVTIPAEPPYTANPACTNPLGNGTSSSPSNCQIVDTLIEMYGDQTTTSGKSPKTKGWIVTALNVAMLWTAWDFIAGGSSCPTPPAITSPFPLNTQPGSNNNPPLTISDPSASVWFNANCLVQYTVNPATAPSTALDFMAAPPAFISWGLGPAVYPASTDTVQTNSNANLGSAQAWVGTPLALASLLGTTTDGTYTFHWSAQDLVGNSEKSVVLLTSTNDPSDTIPCLNGGSDSIPAYPSAGVSCYTTALYTMQLNLDSTAPTISAAFSPTGSPAGTFTLDEPVSVIYTCNDPLNNGVASGIAYCGGVQVLPVGSCPTSFSTTSSPLNTSSIGSFNYSATDCAGNVSAPAQYTVTAAPLTITASSATVPYGTAIPTITPIYIGFVSGQNSSNLTTQPVCSVTVPAGNPVGTYTTSCSGAVDSNYTISYVTGTLKITAVPLTITASSPMVNYGSAVPAITPSYSGFVNGDTSASLTMQPTCATAAHGPPSGSPVGSYPTSCSGAVDSNYNISYMPGTVTIMAVPLSITASSAIVAYGAGIPAITPSYSGFVNGDSASNLTTQPSCGTLATISSNVGGYLSTCSGAVDSNYTITYYNGSVTVNPAATSTSVTSSQNPSNYGDLVTFTATVTNTSSGATPTGTLAFTIDGSPVAATTVSSSGNTMTATYSTAALMVPGSPHSVQATYTNLDGNFVSSNGALSPGQTVNAPTTQTTLVSSTGASASILGQAVAFTATVTDTSDMAAVPSGNVAFYDGNTLIGRATLSAGSATFTTALLSSSASPHSITAAFLGSADFSPSMPSSAVSQAVSPRATTSVVNLSPNTVAVGAPRTVMVTVTDAATTGPSGTPGAFTLAASSLNTARTGHASALLPNGTVLVAGGEGATSGDVLNSAEIYNPVAPSFTSLSPVTLNTARTGATGTLLSNGTVLIVGGSSDGTATNALTSAEIYDPVAVTFTPLTGGGQSLSTARLGHTATLLPNGNVLIAGGQNSSGTLTSTEIYNASTQTFSPALGTLTDARAGHTATLLANGLVLMAGGDTAGDAELYNPSVGSSTGTGSLNTARTNHTATLLLDGNVLIAGGTSSGVAVNTTEIYNTAAGNFTSVASTLTTPRSGQTATFLDDGQVLIVGGTNATPAVLGSAELYTPSFDPLDTVSVSSSDNTDGITGSPCTLTLTGTGATTCQVTDTPSEVGMNPHTLTGTYTPAVSDSVHTGSNGAAPLTVTPAALTITASSATVPYGTAIPTITPIYIGFVSGQNSSNLTTQPVCSVTVPAGNPVGTYTTSCSGAVDSNYTISYVTGTLKITAVPLTITASSPSMTYGGAVPAITAAITGLVNGDTATTIGVTCSTTATSSSPVGSYPSTCTASAGTNYTITYTSGSVTVKPAPLTITASSATVSYGTAIPAITASYSGFVNGQSASNLTTQPSCSTTATSSSPPGTYPTSCSGAVDPNYTISYVNGTVTVTGVWRITTSSPCTTLSSTSFSFGTAVPEGKPGVTCSYIVTNDTATTTSVIVVIPGAGNESAPIVSGEVDPDDFTIVATGTTCATTGTGTSLAFGKTCTVVVNFTGDSDDPSTGNVAYLQVDNASTKALLLQATLNATTQK